MGSGLDNVFHFARELGQAKRFGQEIDVGGSVEALPEGLLDIVRNKDDLEVGLGLADPLNQGCAIHLRHDQIGNK